MHRHPSRHQLGLHPFGDNLFWLKSQNKTITLSPFTFLPPPPNSLFSPFYSKTRPTTTFSTTLKQNKKLFFILPWISFPLSYVSFRTFVVVIVVSVGLSIVYLIFPFSDTFNYLYYYEEIRRWEYLTNIHWVDTKMTWSMTCVCRDMSG